MLALVLASALPVALATAAGGSTAADKGREFVKLRSARNRAVARRDAERRLDRISLPPGAVISPTRPSGIGHRLSEPAAIPGGTRQVSEHRFWTVPGGRRRVYRWLTHHPPRGSSPRENYAGNIYWEHGPPGTLGATGILAAVARADGGTAVRADVFDGWQLPRNPTQIIPGGARFLSLEVVPGAGGFHAEGEEVAPVRRIATARRVLIASLVRVINRQPAFQLFNQPSCGPQGPSSEYRRFIFRFKSRRHGTVLARVSQEKPIGICSPLELQLAGNRPYALEGGWNVIRRARDLIRRARPLPPQTSRKSAPALMMLLRLF